MVARTIDVYEVMDACSEMFLGYSFGAENFLTQYEAYRMALETWKVKPYEIVTDNQGGTRSRKHRPFSRRYATCTRPPCLITARVKPSKALSDVSSSR